MSAILLAVAFVFAADMEPVEPVVFAANEELRSYLAEATENSPALKAKYETWLAALEEIPQARALDNPMFGYTQVLRSRDTNAILDVEQSFPWFGTLKARGDRATLMAEQTLHEFYALRNDIHAQVKQAYFDYALLAERIQIVQAQANILTYIEDIVRSKYAVGMGGEQELYQVQIEQTQLEDQYNALLQSRAGLSARLNRLIARGAQEELPFPQDATLPPTPPPAPIVQARILTNSPELEAMQRMIDAQAKEIALAKKMGYPEFTVGLGYTFMRDMAQNRGTMETFRALDAGRMLYNEPTRMTWQDIVVGAGEAQLFEPSEDSQDEVMVTLRMSIPIWRKKVKAGVEQAKHREQAAEWQRKDKSLELVSQASGILYEITDATRRLTVLSDSLIPKAQLTYDSTVSAYGTRADGDFLQLLNSQRMLLDFQLGQAEATHDLHVASAMLEALMGGPWSPQEPDTTAQVEALSVP